MNKRISLLALSVSVFSACGVPDTLPTQQVPDAGNTQPTLVQQGQALVAANGCESCHTGSMGTLGGSAIAPNLTPDMDTGIGSWSDDLIAGALRYGADDEGATLCSRMPRFTSMSDDDMKALVAYLRSLSVVSNDVENTGCTPTPADVALHGEYVVQLKACAGCHGADLSGVSTAIPGSMAYAPNLTPDMSTGIGGWTDVQMTGAIEMGIDDQGETLCQIMPRFADLTDDELSGVIGYLRSLPAVSHDIPDSTCTSDSDPTALGKTAVQARGCASCHGTNLAGSTTPLPHTQIYPPNLTPDMDTGIGSWTPMLIVRALKMGVDDQDETLCSVMPRYATMTDDEANNIAAYLLSLAPISNDVPDSVCGDVSTPDAGTQPTPDAGMTMPVDAGMPVCTMSPPVVISQVYGAGGNTNALFSADFVELHNRSDAAADVSGWSIQYASAAGTAWTVAAIPPGTTLAAGAFALLDVGPVGTHGAALPSTAIALSRTIDLAATNGKVALVSSATALTGACPASAGWVDFVGYGTANCSDGSAAVAPLSAVLAAQRGSMTGTDIACVESHINASDFVTAAPAPHGTATSVCSCP